MTAIELFRILRRRATRLGKDHRERPAKGGHVVVRHGGRTTTVSMHRGVADRHLSRYPAAAWAVGR